MKTLKLKPETHKELSYLKIVLNLKTIDETIKFLLEEYIKNDSKQK